MARKTQKPAHEGIDAKTASNIIMASSGSLKDKEVDPRKLIGTIHIKKYLAMECINHEYETWISLIKKTLLAKKEGTDVELTAEENKLFEECRSRTSEYLEEDGSEALKKKVSEQTDELEKLKSIASSMKYKFSTYSFEVLTHVINLMVRELLVFTCDNCIASSGKLTKASHVPWSELNNKMLSGLYMNTKYVFDLIHGSSDASLPEDATKPDELMEPVVEETSATESPTEEETTEDEVMMTPETDVTEDDADNEEEDESDSPEATQEDSEELPADVNPDEVVTQEVDLTAEENVKLTQEVSVTAPIKTKQVRPKLTQYITNSFKEITSREPRFNGLLLGKDLTALVNDLVYQVIDRYVNIIKSLLTLANSKTITDRLAVIATKILLQDDIHTSNEDVRVILDVVQARIEDLKTHGKKDKLEIGDGEMEAPQSTDEQFQAEVATAQPTLDGTQTVDGGVARTTEGVQPVEGQVSQVTNGVAQVNLAEGPNTPSATDAAAPPTLTPTTDAAALANSNTTAQVGAVADGQTNASGNEQTQLADSVNTVVAGTTLDGQNNVAGKQVTRTVEVVPLTGIDPSLEPSSIRVHDAETGRVPVEEKRVRRVSKKKTVV